MDDKVFGVVSTISGLVVGWSLNELSYLFKAGRENKKVLNQVLFIQLEIRDLIGKTDLELVEKQFSLLLAQRFPNENQIEMQNFVGQLFYGMIQSELNNKFSNKIKELAKDYKNYISELSRIDPFVTYYISNKDIILDYLGYINEYLEKIRKYLPGTSLTEELKEHQDTGATFKMVMDKMRSAMTPIIRKDALDTIETDLCTVARKIGIIKYYRTKRFINKTKKWQFNPEDLKKIEAYFDNVMLK